MPPLKVVVASSVDDQRDVLQDDLVGLHRELESEAKQLQQDRGKQERLATTITNQMQSDAQVSDE